MTKLQTFLVLGVIFWFTETEALFVQNRLYAHTRTQVLEGQFFIPGQILQCGGLQLE